LADSYHWLKVYPFLRRFGAGAEDYPIVGLPKGTARRGSITLPTSGRDWNRAKSGCAARLLNLPVQLRHFPGASSRRLAISKLYRYCAGTNHCWIVSGPPTELGSLFHFSQHLLDELGTGCWQIALPCRPEGEANFAAACQRVPALCFRPVGRGLAQESGSGRCDCRLLCR
jgi:hypothetical protein